MKTQDKIGLAGIIALILSAYLFLIADSGVLDLFAFAGLCWAIGYVINKSQQLSKELEEIKI